jgi:hypothetical protein
MDMFNKKKSFHASGLLTSLSRGLLPAITQAENCIEAPVGGQVYSLINAGCGLAHHVYG